MQQTTLGCDWCAAGKNGLRPYAVSTLALTNGKRTAKTPTLDLCARHIRQLTKQFRPMKKVRGPYKITKQERTRRATKHDPMWKEREEKVLAALKGKEGGLKGPELTKAAKLTKHYIYKVTTRLLEAGKVKRVGANGERRGFVLA